MGDELSKHEQFVGEKKIECIRRKAVKLHGKEILNINSTYQGGGVAEILNSLIPLMNSIDVEAGWRILHGSPDFFRTTKKFGNGLHGEKIHFTKAKQKIYEGTCERFSKFTHIHHDAVIIHDIQPLALAKFYKKRQPWIWRCHSDIEHANRQTYSYLRKFIQKYDYAVMLSEKFVKRDINPPQVVMPPSIDPLNTKNKEIGDEVVHRYLKKFGIPRDKPIVCQISRFDKWKDHLGAIKIFKEVRKKADCRLVLVGGAALDDPMGPIIHEEIIKSAEGDNDIQVIDNAPDILVNSLQRESSVVLQKSLREGFGLTVTEALWKGTPVVASDVGGISSQITDGKNGYLVNPTDLRGFSQRIIKLLKDSQLRRKIGKFGKEYVGKHFLIANHLLNWIALLNKVFEDEKNYRRK